MAADASNGSGTTITNLEAMRAVGSYLEAEPAAERGLHRRVRRRRGAPRRQRARALRRRRPDRDQRHNEGSSRRARRAELEHVSNRGHTARRLQREACGTAPQAGKRPRSTQSLSQRPRSPRRSVYMHVTRPPAAAGLRAGLDLDRRGARSRCSRPRRRARERRRPARRRRRRRLHRRRRLGDAERVVRRSRCSRSSTSTAPRWGSHAARRLADADERRPTGSRCTWPTTAT